jgi:hypothetical protein
MEIRQTVGNVIFRLIQSIPYKNITDAVTLAFAGGSE